MRILVVGAGVAGLAAARTLAACRLHGRGGRAATRLGPGGDGYLPAWERLSSAAGTRSRTVRSRREEPSYPGSASAMSAAGCSRGRCRGAVGRSRSLPRARPRSELHAVLLEGARDVPIRMGAPFADSTTRRARLGRVRRREFRRIRPRDRRGRNPQHGPPAHLRPGREGRPVGQVGWRFVTVCPPEITTWSACWAPGRPFSPFRSGMARCTATATSRRNPVPSCTRIPPSSSPTSRSPRSSSSSRSPGGATYIARRSRRSRSPHGCSGEVLLVGTRRTPPRPTWPRAPRWRWKTRWCWRSASLDRTLSPPR